MNSENKVKAVLFDFNGTMIYDSPIHAAVWFDFVPQHGGGTITNEDVEKRCLGRDNAQILTDFFGKLSDEEIERLAYEKEAEYRRRCRLDPKRFRLNPGLTDFLDWLRAEKIPINIATGSEINNLNFYFERPEIGLGRWFDRSLVVYDDGSFPGKPNPDIYLRAAAALGVSCADCLVFEDSYSGVLAAHRAGAKYVVALGEGVRAEKFADIGGVDLAVEDFTGFRSFPGLF